MESPLTRTSDGLSDVEPGSAANKQPELKPVITLEHPPTAVADILKKSRRLIDSTILASISIDPHIAIKFPLI